MSAMFDKPPSRAQPTAPSPSDPALQAARDATGQAASAAFGRGATIATSGQGVPTPATTAKKTLLGGAGG